MSVSGHSYPTGKIQVIGNIFQFTVDVSEFSPEDVVIIFSNNLMEVHAEKVRGRKENYVMVKPARVQRRLSACERSIKLQT